MVAPLPLAWAHDPGISTVQGEWRSDELVLTTGFSPTDVEYLLPPSVPRTEKWGQADFDAARDHLVAIAPRLWEVWADKVLLPWRDVRVELLPGDSVSFHLVAAPVPAGAELTLRSVKIPDLPPGHHQFVIITDERGSTVAKKLLSARDFTLEVPRAGAPGMSAPAPVPGATRVEAPEEAGDLPSITAFIRLGIEHIWTGYDHLLFLFALLVVCRTFRSIVGIVTFFTLAHSLTLALATLNLVSLPSRWVEPLIAASIVFVGVENLLARGAEPRGRWALTFAFGLIHGFGFASVLRDLGLGGDGQSILMPLFTFNLGVEIGQIALAAVVLPIVWQLRKNDRFVRQGVPALSLLVSGAGVYWLLERTVLR